MEMASLPPAVIERIKQYRYDRILEKHEGPERWADVLTYDDPEFLTFDGFDVLLPVDRESHPNLTSIRVIPGADGRTLTLFLKDTTYVTDPSNEIFEAGRVAICEKFEDQDFYLGILYHEWFIVENPSTGA